MIPNPKDFGIKQNHLYETLVTTIEYNEKKDKMIPNTSSIGVTLSSENSFLIKLFHNTKTYDNLIKNNYLCINFISDVYLFALASLKIQNSSIRNKSFPEIYYDYLNISDNNLIRSNFQNTFNRNINRLPFINKSWLIFICKLDVEKKKNQQDILGDFLISEIKVKILFHRKFQESFKLFDRSENIVLESIILATRLKVAYEKENKELLSKIYNEIIENKEKVLKITKNKHILKIFNKIMLYIERFVNHD
ncbi:MAG: DUF447 family protein [Candidatus Lokiarchaeota archaeon]|nr:DUF447 family protein [Candidatus Lokiarchaeota archaeon]